MEVSGNRARGMKTAGEPVLIIAKGGRSGERASWTGLSYPVHAIYGPKILFSAHFGALKLFWCTALTYGPDLGVQICYLGETPKKVKSSGTVVATSRLRHF